MAWVRPACHGPCAEADGPHALPCTQLYTYQCIRAQISAQNSADPCTRLVHKTRAQIGTQSSTHISLKTSTHAGTQMGTEISTEICTQISTQPGNYATKQPLHQATRQPGNHVSGALIRVVTIPGNYFIVVSEVGE